MAENDTETLVPEINDSFGTENLYEWYAAPVRIKVSKEEYKPGDIDEMIGTTLPIEEGGEEVDSPKTDEQ